VVFSFTVGSAPGAGPSQIPGILGAHGWFPSWVGPHPVQRRGTGRAVRSDARYGRRVPGSQARARERVERLCASPGEARTLRLAVLAVLRDHVHADYFVWVVTDPVSEVGSSPVARVPDGAHLPTLIRAKYLSGVNRWTALGVGGTPAVRTLRDGQDGVRAGDRTWLDLLAGYGIGDVASLVLRDSYGCWGFLDLWRAAGRGPVPDEDVALLADIAPAVTGGLRRSLAATFAGVPVAQARGEGPAVVLLDDDLGIAGASPAAGTWLARLLPPSGGAAPVPAATYNVAAQLVAREQGVDDHPPSARVHLSGGYWLTLRAARLGVSGQPGIVVTLEETPPLDRVDLFGRCHGLSPREREVLTALVQGAATRDLAGRLHISENTVQDHLKSVFAKTGARSRQSLLAWALGARPDA